MYYLHIYLLIIYLYLNTPINYELIDNGSWRSTWVILTWRCRFRFVSSSTLKLLFVLLLFSSRTRGQMLMLLLLMLLLVVMVVVVVMVMVVLVLASRLLLDGKGYLTSHPQLVHRTLGLIRGGKVGLDAALLRQCATIASN